MHHPRPHRTTVRRLVVIALALTALALPACPASAGTGDLGPASPVTAKSSPTSGAGRPAVYRRPERREDRRLRHPVRDRRRPMVRCPLPGERHA